MKRFLFLALLVLPFIQCTSGQSVTSVLEDASDKQAAEGMANIHTFAEVEIYQQYFSPVPLQTFYAECKTTVRTPVTGDKFESRTVVSSRSDCVPFTGYYAVYVIFRYDGKEYLLPAAVRHLDKRIVTVKKLTTNEGRTVLVETYTD
jgi:hypothetical protein